MWLPFVLVGFLFAKAWAFAPAPIQWGAAPGRNFVVAPRVSPDKGFLLNKESLSNRATPAKLALRDVSGSSAPEDIPHFTANLDNTISWDAAGLCLEASGDKSEDAIGVNQCNGGPTQLWNFVPAGHGKGDQIRLKDIEKCMDVNVNANPKNGLNGAAIELRECNDKETETWRLGGPVAVPLVAKYESRQQAMTIPLVLFVGFGTLFVTVSAVARIAVLIPSAMIWGALSANAATVLGCFGWSTRATSVGMTQENVFLRVDLEQQEPCVIDVPSSSATPVQRISGITDAGTAATTQSSRSGDMKMIGLFGNKEDRGGIGPIKFIRFIIGIAIKLLRFMIGVAIKCIRFIIGVPLILLSCFLSLFFFLLWIALLPITCCCPGGPLVACIGWIFENLVKLPINLARRIVGM